MFFFTGAYKALAEALAEAPANSAMSNLLIISIKFLDWRLPLSKVGRGGGLYILCRSSHPEGVYCLLPLMHN